MDPNEILEQIRERVKLTTEHATEYDYGADIWLAEKFQELDDWLSKGGFLPNDWQHHFVKVGWVSVAREQFVPVEGLQPGRFEVYRFKERAS